MHDQRPKQLTTAASAKSKKGLNCGQPLGFTPANLTNSWSYQQFRSLWRRDIRVTTHLAVRNMANKNSEVWTTKHFVEVPPCSTIRWFQNDPYDIPWCPIKFQNISPFFRMFHHFSPFSWPKAILTSWNPSDGQGGKNWMRLPGSTPKATRWLRSQVSDTRWK